MTVAMAERPPFDAAFGTVSEVEKRSDLAVDDRLPGSFTGLSSGAKTSRSVHAGSAARRAR